MDLAILEMCLSGSQEFVMEVTDEILVTMFIMILAPIVIIITISYIFIIITASPLQSSQSYLLKPSHLKVDRGWKKKG